MAGLRVWVRARVVLGPGFGIGPSFGVRIGLGLDSGSEFGVGLMGMLAMVYGLTCVSVCGNALVCMGVR